MDQQCVCVVLDAQPVHRIRLLVQASNRLAVSALVGDERRPSPSAAGRPGRSGVGSPLL